MKKAKEYAAEFVATLRSNPATDEVLDGAVKNVWDGLIEEIGELLKIRKPRSPLGISAVFYEQDRKWRAIARRVNAVFELDVLREDGFLPVLHKAFPMARFIIRTGKDEK